MEICGAVFEVAVHILAKAPMPGAVKTRLIPCLGPQGAARLQQWMTKRTVLTALRAAIGPVTLWCTPVLFQPNLSHETAAYPLILRQQPDGDLGLRMGTALNSTTTASGSLVIGTDCPILTVGHLQQASQSLRSGRDAFFLPTEDGGYFLAAMRRFHPMVFDDMAWSTQRVMTDTRTRLTALGWRWSEPETVWDVDRPEDWQRLITLFPNLPLELTKND
ncbi:MAG: TIGR04282 family arsenosugar biosynthesis glycosyltransferase [Magnetococcales bacterium]|nr:TIGR04282 family arsenosugar biosynthesis glycosyltransferase [Magnetococcales bacterium]